MQIILNRNQRYLDVGKKIRIGVKGERINVHPDFCSYLSPEVYTVATERVTTEKTLDKMNWLELANKALSMQLIESIEKAQEEKLTKAQLIDKINGENV